MTLAEEPNLLHYCTFFSVRNQRENLKELVEDVNQGSGRANKQPKQPNRHDQTIFDDHQGLFHSMRLIPERAKFNYGWKHETQCRQAQGTAE